MGFNVMSDRDLPDVLNAEQEVELCHAIEAGVVAGAALAGRMPWPRHATRAELVVLVQQGRTAWEEFILANLKMVAMLAGGAARRSQVNHEELFQEGCLGLAQALMRFDASQGVRFSTYGLPWVRNSVLTHLARRGGQSDSPVWRARQARALRRRQTELESGAGHPVSLAEAAASMGRDAAWARLITSDGQRVPLEDAHLLREAIVPSASECLEATLFERPAWLADLGSQEATVIALRYGLDDGIEREYPQVARRMGCSVSTVRRLERRALQRARTLVSVTGEALPVAA